MPPPTLATNLADIPYELAQKLNANISDNEWRAIVAQLPPEEALTHSESTQSTSRLLLVLGNRGLTVKHLLRLLDKCQLERPQLLLRRKFGMSEQRAMAISTTVATTITSPATVTTDIDHGTHVLSCAAAGFPYPRYEWYVDGQMVARGASVRLADCAACTASGVYTCYISNSLPTDAAGSGDWLADYAHRPNTSHVTTNGVLLSIAASRLCAECATDYTAVDKVALIVANGAYEHLAPLRTPLCDAHTAAAGLLALHFKTVTLADLTRAEMLRVLDEYDALLGTQGVYGVMIALTTCTKITAVFYYVGHGFEANGQCYLLPVDAPVDATPDDCIAVDGDVLARMQQHRPALNLILLDMCRKFVP